MKNEKLLHVDDMEIARGGMVRLFKTFGLKDGHELKQASSKEEVEILMKNGMKPTVAILDKNMPGENDGEETAKIIRKYSSNTIIISLSANEGVTFGDYNLTKDIQGKALFEFITNLKH